MKTSSFFSLTLLLLVSIKPLLHLRSSALVNPPDVWTEQTLSGKTVYYFLETQCSDCLPGGGQTTGKYVVVTPGIDIADYADHYQLLERFRATLAAQFPHARALRDGLEFRFEFTVGDAEKFRQAELEQKRAAGYEIVELELTQ